MSRRRAWAAASLVLGTLAGLLAAELAVRAFGLELHQRVPLLTATTPDERTRLLCYPSDPHDDFPLDLRDQATFERFAKLPGFERLEQMRRLTPDCMPLISNSDGARDREYAAAKPAGCLRIMCLGDSMTHGYGVADDAPWPRQLERLLKADYPGRCFEVMNYGRVGMDLEQVAGLAAAMLPRYRPDLVLYGFCLNDAPHGALPADSLPSDSALLLNLDRAPLRGPLERSALARYVSEALYQRRVSQATIEWYNELYGEANEQGLRRMYRILRDLKLMSEAGGGRLVIAVLPLMTEFDENYPFALAHQTMRSFGRVFGVPVIDALPAFSGRNPRELWIHKIDHHPNRQGQEIYAKAVEQGLREIDPEMFGPPGN